MRIISQKNAGSGCTIDLPYEQIAVTRNGAKIYASSTHAEIDRPWIMAEYDSEEKAEMAMELLLDTYAALAILEYIKRESAEKVISGVAKEKSVSFVRFKFPENDVVKKVYEEQFGGEEDD